jgi:hypothetical protein
LDDSGYVIAVSGPEAPAGEGPRAGALPGRLFRLSAVGVEHVGPGGPAAAAGVLDQFTPLDNRGLKFYFRTVSKQG